MQSGFGKALRSARKAHHLTQAELASRAKLTIVTLRELEQNRGTLNSFDKAISALKLRVAGSNLPSASHLGESIALLRKRRGISQRDFAKELGCTHPTIVGLERHARGRMETVCSALKILGAGASLVGEGQSISFFTSVAVSSANNNWTTPPELLADIVEQVGRFDLDPCSPEKLSHRIPAKHHFTEADNGLMLPWFGRVFLNPPYGRHIKSWMRKAHAESRREEVASIIALVPARTDTSWWHEHVADRAHVWFLRGRLVFGKGRNVAPFPSALIAWKVSREVAAKLCASLEAYYVPPFEIEP